MCILCAPSQSCANNTIILLHQYLFQRINYVQDAVLIPGNAADMLKNKADVYSACLYRAQSLVGETIAFACFTPLYSELKKWDLPLVPLLLVPGTCQCSLMNVTAQSRVESSVHFRDFTITVTHILFCKTTSCAHCETELYAQLIYLLCDYIAFAYFKVCCKKKFVQRQKVIRNCLNSNSLDYYPQWKNNQQGKTS